MIVPIQKSLYKEYFPEESKRVPFDELTKRISLVLVNSHPSIGIARPLLPNAIEIAGYHIKDPEVLPEVIYSTFYFLKLSMIDYALDKHILIFRI